MTIRTRALGHLQIQDPLGTRTFETFTCSHCNSIVTMPEGKPVTMADHYLHGVKDVRKCAGCDALICPRCHKEPSCTPFMKKIEAAERREALRSWV